MLCMIVVWVTGFWDGAWNDSSEQLVWGRIRAVQAEGVFTRGSFLLRWTANEEVNNLAAGNAITGTPEMYPAQSGLQGTLFAMISKALTWAGLPNARLPMAMRILNSTFSLLVFGAFSLWLYWEIGLAAAVGALSCIFFSDPLTWYFPNLYWVVWTLLLPTVVTAYWARTKTRKELSPVSERKWQILLFVTILARFMCGFEFTPLVMLSSELPILFYFLRDFENREMRRKWFWMAFRIGMLELLAFGAAIAIWMLQLLVYWQGDGQRVIDFVLRQVAKRTGAFAEGREIPEIYHESLEASRMSVVRNYLLSGNSIYQGKSLKKIAAVAAAAVVTDHCLQKDGWRPVAKQLAFLTACLLPAISWYFLASAHAYIHTRLMQLLPLLPFIPVAAGMILQSAVDLLRYAADTARSRGYGGGLCSTAGGDRKTP